MSAKPRCNELTDNINGTMNVAATHSDTRPRHEQTYSDALSHLVPRTLANKKLARKHRAHIVSLSSGHSARARRWTAVYAPA